MTILMTSMTPTVALAVCNEFGFPWFSAVNLTTGVGSEWSSPEWDDPFWDVPPHTTDFDSHSVIFGCAKLTDTTAIYVSSSRWHRKTMANFAIPLTVSAGGVAVGAPISLALDIANDGDGWPIRVFGDYGGGASWQPATSFVNYLSDGQASFIYSSSNGPKVALLNSSGLSGHASTFLVPDDSIVHVENSPTDFYVRTVSGYRRRAVLSGGVLTMENHGFSSSIYRVSRIGTAINPTTGYGYYQGWGSSDTGVAIGVADGVTQKDDTWALFTLGANDLKYYDRFGSSDKEVQFTRVAGGTFDADGRRNAHFIVDRDILLDWVPKSTSDTVPRRWVIARFTLPLLLPKGGWSIHFIRMSS